MPNLPEHIKEQMQRYGIKIPTQLPLFKSEPREDHLREWADSQITPKLRAIAHKMVANLHYTSFAEFLEQLRKTIIEFNQKIKDEPYVLVLSESREYKLERGCSAQWVIALALEYCDLKMPTAIITGAELPEFCKKNPDLKNVLFLDDAAYSGQQKVEVFGSYFDKYMCESGEHEQMQHLHVYIGIPFQTASATNRFLDFTHNSKEVGFANITILDHQIMPTMIDILTPEEVAYLQAIETPYINNSHTLTYFDHVYADFMSCYVAIAEGYSIFQAAQISILLMMLGFARAGENFHKIKGVMIISSEKYNELASMVFPNYYTNYSGYNIPIIIPPYRIKETDNLATTLANGLLGARSEYPIHDPNTQAILARITPRQTNYQKYKSTSLTLEQQTALDEIITTAALNHRTFTEEVKLRLHQRSSILSQIKPPSMSLLSRLIALFALIVVSLKHSKQVPPGALTDTNQPATTEPTSKEQTPQSREQQNSAFYSYTKLPSDPVDPICTTTDPDAPQTKSKVKKKP